MRLTIKSTKYSSLKRRRYEALLILGFTSMTTLLCMEPLCLATQEAQKLNHEIRAFFLSPLVLPAYYQLQNLIGLTDEMTAESIEQLMSQRIVISARNLQAHLESELVLADLGNFDSDTSLHHKSLSIMILAISISHNHQDKAHYDANRDFSPFDA